MPGLYTYTPLSGQRKIRLLRFLDKDGPITCTLYETELGLQKGPKYHALSYTWGPPEGEEISDDVANSSPDKHCVSCDGKELMVTENCYNALHQLRIAASGTGVGGGIESLWVDAICIDQENILERNAQVTIMGTIYAQAEAVICWIGKPDAETAEAMSLIWKIGTALDDDTPGLEYGDWSSYQFNDPVFYERCGMPPVSQQQWCLILKFFMKRWFERVWVLQEIILAREAFIYCGDFLDIDPLFIFVIFLSYSGWISAVAYLRSISFPNDGKSGQISLLQVAGMLRVYRKQGPEDPAYRKKHEDIFQAETSTQWQYAYLESIISSMSVFQVTDPRDKVFAPLALASYYINPSLNSQWMVPDYGLSTRQVYINMSCNILRNSNSLSLLSAVERSANGVIPDLPSWVPDLCVSKTAVSLLIMPPHYHATRHWKFEQHLVECSESTGLLKVNGFIPDSIATVAPPLEDILLQHSVWEWLALISHLPSESYIDEHPLVTLRRALVSDQIHTVNGEPAENTHLSFRSYILFEMAMALSETKNRDKDVTAFWDSHKIYTKYAVDDTLLPTPTEIIEASDFRSRLGKSGWDHMPHEFAQMKDYRAVLGRVSAGRRLVLTQRGLIGLGPSVCGIGDSIAYLQGGRVPFVLRAVADGYQLLGEAYVHGFMDGQITEWGVPDLIPIVLK